MLGKRVPVPPGRFQRLDVDADVSIKDFVTSTGAVFKAGRGFYELSKPEDVSDKVSAGRGGAPPLPATPPPACRKKSLLSTSPRESSSAALTPGISSGSLPRAVARCARRTSLLATASMSRARGAQRAEAGGSGAPRHTGRHRCSYNRKLVAGTAFLYEMSN